MKVIYDQSSYGWIAHQTDWDLGMPSGISTTTKREAFNNLMEQLDDALEHRMLWALNVIDRCPHFDDIYKIAI